VGAVPPPELLLVLLPPLELELPELTTPELLLLDPLPLLEPPKPDELLLDPPELFELLLPPLLLLDPLDPDELLLPEEPLDPDELLLGSSGFCPPLPLPLLLRAAGDTLPPSSEGGGSCVVPP
jgi:hypothetical protein